MSQLTVQQIFGVNAYQNAEFLVCNKSDFLNLTNTATNKAESLLAAIILKLHSNFEGSVFDENNSALTDELNRPITFSNFNLYELLNVFYWKKQLLEGKIIDTFIIEHNAIP